MNRPFVRLEILENGASKGLVELPAHGHFVVGRQKGCDVMLGAAGVSRRHALLAIDPEERLIHDLGSKNGTYVNGKQVEGETSFASGDTIRLGPSVMLLVSISNDTIEIAAQKLQPTPAPKRVPPPPAPHPHHANPDAGLIFCEACDATLRRDGLKPGAPVLRLDDGAVICSACAPGVVTRELVASRYRIIAKLGEGAVATVSKAIDEEVRRVVAVKMMRAQASEMTIAYLERETEILRALGHPNIVSLLDAGEHKGSRFIVMELVQGADLSSIIATKGVVPPAAAALVGFGVASGLALAHKRGVVHRDVKPSNVLIERSGVVKLADFGVARWAREGKKRGSSDRLTVRGSRRGTPAYMAPEQARDPAAAGPAADVYGLGATLYHALSGSPPYGEGAAPGVILEKLDRGEPPAPFAGGAGSGALAAAIQRAMEHDPGKRFADGEAFRAVLLDLVDGSTDVAALVH
jgi:tRNA A-37 threonylcarbamoyl transferase component Bud32